MGRNEFALRLGRLRTQKGIAAKTMSELLGQNHGYISKIESGRAYPSFDVFFRICEYLDVTPSEFFDDENDAPVHLREIVEDLKRLDARQLEMIAPVIRGLIR